MKVKVRIERTAESLDQRHGTGHSARARQAGFANEVSRDRAMEDAKHVFNGQEAREMPTLQEIRALSPHLYARAGHEVSAVHDPIAHTDPT